MNLSLSLLYGHLDENETPIHSIPNMILSLLQQLSRHDGCHEVIKNLFESKKSQKDVTDETPEMASARMKAERRKRAAEIRKQMLEKLKKDQATFASSNQDDLKEIDTKVFSGKGAVVRTILNYLKKHVTPQYLFPVLFRKQHSRICLWGL